MVTKEVHFVAEELQLARLRLTEPPFVSPPSAVCRKHNYWMMCQQHGTPSYHFLLPVSHLLCSLCSFGWRRSGQFNLVYFVHSGVNALAGYILHGLSQGYVMSWLHIEPQSSAFIV